MISVNNVTKTFKLSRQQKREMGSQFRGSQIDAVQNVGFECHPGRIFSLLGPNGAGKTTTLRMIATTLKPSTGEITVAGHNTVTQAQDVRRALGFLTGSTRLYDRLTAAEIIRYHADLHGIRNDDYKKRRDEIFDLLEMGAFSDRRISKLSTGMKQKVSIARTIIHDPEVLVFDEATSGLDVVASRGIVELIRNAKNRGKTVLFSTHRMGEVSQLSDDLAIIHRGSLLYNGPFDSFTAQMQATSLEDEFIRVIERAEVTA